MNTYPFIFPKGNDGKYYIDTFYIYETSDAVLKSMYFGRRNKTIKESIKDALKDCNKISFRETVNYDVSFDYDPASNKAWYSEEYRGTGNGHYYLALNENTALFCEND